MITILCILDMDDFKTRGKYFCPYRFHIHSNYEYIRKSNDSIVTDDSMISMNTKMPNIWMLVNTAFILSISIYSFPYETMCPQGLMVTPVFSKQFEKWQCLIIWLRLCKLQQNQLPLHKMKERIYCDTNCNTRSRTWRLDMWRVAIIFKNPDCIYISFFI